MITLQKVTHVKAKVYPEPAATVIEWTCPECEQHHIEHTYHIEGRIKLHCERCGRCFTRIP